MNVNLIMKPYEKYDDLYGIITSRIIRIYDRENVQYMPKARPKERPNARNLRILDETREITDVPEKQTDATQEHLFRIKYVVLPSVTSYAKSVNPIDYNVVSSEDCNILCIKEPPTTTFTIDKTTLSSDILKQMEDSKIWSDLHGHISPETYTARLIMYAITKRPIPIFTSKSTFRIKELIKEMDNRFISTKTREELINHFCKFKQIYWGFTKVARIWKIRHTPTRIQTDLYMNELDPSHKYTFQLINTNGIYLFSLQNLARIVVDAITHQSGMFLAPLTIKNPYTNDLLSKCDLFNIYFSLLHAHLRIHEMLEKFFKCEFNVFEFRRKHETELRDIAIEQYTKTATTGELAQDVDDMLRLHKMTNRIKIMPGFPQKQLVDTMRPFLKIYLMERFSFSSMTRKYSAKKLDKILNQFAEQNPKYGRKITSCIAPTSNSIQNPFLPKTPNPKCVKSEKFITETTQTVDYCRSKYMNTHVYDEDIFDRYIDAGDTINTYEPEPDEEDFWTEEESPVYVFTAPTIPIVTIRNTAPRSISHIRQNAIEILSRFGRLHTPSSQNQPTESQIQQETQDQNQNQTQDQDEDQDQETQYQTQDQDEEEDEEEDEEVIMNTEDDNDENQSDTESDTDWEDDNDSIS